MIYNKHSKNIGILYDVPNSMLSLRKYEVPITEEVTFFLATPRGKWNLRFPIRDLTHTPYNGDLKF